MTADAYRYGHKDGSYEVSHGGRPLTDEQLSQIDPAYADGYRKAYAEAAATTAPTAGRIRPLTAEEIARAFHSSYEKLAPRHGYKTREESAKPWEDVPEANRALMTATVESLLHTGFIHPGTAKE